MGVGRKTEEAAIRDIDRHMYALSIGLLESSFLLGELISLADISVYAQLVWIRKNSEGDAAVSNYQNIDRWMERVNLATQKTI